jgi:hypothetical protein
MEFRSAAVIPSIWIASVTLTAPILSEKRCIQDTCERRAGGGAPRIAGRAAAAEVSSIWLASGSDASKSLHKLALLGSTPCGTPPLPIGCAALMPAPPEALQGVHRGSMRAVATQWLHQNDQRPKHSPKPLM